MELRKMVGFVMTARPEQAVAFYRDVLGFTFLKDDGFALVFDAHGTMLRVGKAREWAPAVGTVLGWQVEDLDQAVAALQGRGVAFDRPPFLPPGDSVVCTFPTGDRVAWFKDPDGNVLSLSQHA